MTPIMFCGVRFLVSALVLAPLAYRESRRLRTARPLRLRDGLQALAVGLCLALAISLQQVGLVTTTATNAGFLTAIYIAFVPFYSRILQRVPLRFSLLLACAIVIAGAWLLGGSGGHGWARGDALVLGSDFIWALHITLISKFLATTGRPFFLCLVQYAVTALVGITGGLLLEPVAWSAMPHAWLAILYTGVLSGGVAYTLQILAQSHTPASEAGMILSLESVFAALAAAALLGERLTLMASLGCALILAGIGMVEANALWEKRARRKNL